MIMKDFEIYNEIGQELTLKILENTIEDFFYLVYGIINCPFKFNKKMLLHYTEDPKSIEKNS